METTQAKANVSPTEEISQEWLDRMDAKLDEALVIANRAAAERVEDSELEKAQKGYWEAVNGHNYRQYKADVKAALEKNYREGYYAGMKAVAFFAAISQLVWIFLVYLLIRG